MCQFADNVPVGDYVCLAAVNLPCDNCGVTFRRTKVMTRYRGHGRIAKTLFCMFDIEDDMICPYCDHEHTNITRACESTLEANYAVGLLNGFFEATEGKVTHDANELAKGN